MPVSFSAVRDALKTAVQAIGQLEVYDTAPGQVVTPAAVVLPGDPAVSYDSSMGRESDDLQFIIRLIVKQGADYAAQNELDAYLAGTGPRSVKQAVDGNLGGLVAYARVTQARNYGEYDYNGVTYLGVEFVVEVGT